MYKICTSEINAVLKSREKGADTQVKLETVQIRMKSGLPCKTNYKRHIVQNHNICLNDESYLGPTEWTDHAEPLVQLADHFRLQWGGLIILK